MEKTTISLIIVCLILAGVGYFIYINQGSKQIEGYSNVTIIAESNNKKVATGFIIEINGEIIGGNTSMSPELLKIKNGLVKIYNSNLENQNYYIEEYNINLTGENKRIKFDLDAPKEIKYNLTDSNPINITLYSENARDLDFCLSWSLNYLRVSALNSTKIEKIKNKECYDGGFSLLNSNKTIQIEYSKFGELTKNDYIELMLIVGDTNGKTTQIVKIK